MKDADLIALTQKLLDSIVQGDYETYESLCAPDLTCFEPESDGHQVEGLEFHKFFFDLPSDPAVKTIVSMSGARVRHLGGTAAVVSYVRINQTYREGGAPKITKACETRVWVKEEHGNVWKNVHMHRSST